MSVTILGLPIQNVSMSEAVADVYGFFGARDSKIVVTPNAEILQMYTSDPAMKEALDRADYIVPDGIGVLMAAKRLGTPLKEKVAGVDLARNGHGTNAAIGSIVSFGTAVGVYVRRVDKYRLHTAKR